MRRFIPILFVTLVLFVSTVGVAPTAHAGVCDASTPDSSRFYDEFGTCYTTQTEATAAETAHMSASTAADQAINQTSNQASQSKTGSTEDDVYNGVMIKIMSLFAWLVGAAMLLLNYAMYFTVVAMGTYIHNLDAVGTTWSILRDVGNIMLIFGFLAVGVTTILNVSWYGGGKKMLPMMLAAAVFLNFSLFISEAFIDVSNLFATQFYTQINGPLLSTTDATLTQLAQEGVSGKIMSQLGLAAIYGEVKNGNGKALLGSNPWFVGFMGILLFIILTFVLLSLAFVLIMRFIILIFLIILSPVAFAGLAIPGLKARMMSWWEKLFEQILTAPILLLMLYIALRVITADNFLKGFNGGNAASWTSFTGDNFVNFAGVLLSFLVAMGLLIAVVMQSKNLSAFGANQASALAGKLTGAVTFGALSLAGRSTLGLAGYGLNAKWIQRRAAQSGLKGFGYKAMSFAGRNLENKTFDLRNIPGAGKLGAGMNAIPGLGKAGFGKVFEGGATVTTQTAIDKTREGFKYVKPFTGEWWRESQKMYETAKSELDRKDLIASATPGSADVQKELKKMSVDELAQLKDIRGGIEKLVFNLTPEKFNELMKSDKLLPGEKGKLSRKWDEQFATPGAAATAIGRFTTEEIASLGGSTLSKTDVIDTLGANEFEAIRRKGNLTKQQRRDIFNRMTSPAAPPALSAAVTDYFLAANDPGRNRAKYWDV